jgi:cytochrome b561
MTNSQAYYPRPIIIMHWLTLLLLIGVYASIELHGIFPKDDPWYSTLKTWHFMLGLSVLFLTVLRLAMRAIWRQLPVIEPAAPALQEALGKLVHLVLYVFLLGLPLAGWAILSAAGKPIPFFGLELPPLIGVNKELSKQIKEVHETVANIGYGLIGLHTLAALYHHYIVKDNTLTRMLPIMSPPK